MSHILVIDDDKDLLRLMYQALKGEYEVTLCEEVQKLQPSQLSHFDLILLDVMMPGQDGFAFLRENRDHIDAPVLFLTAKDFEDDKLEGFASGADDYITKPFSVKELRSRIAAHLRREKREKHVRLVDAPVSCDLFQKTFYVRQAAVQLTPSEYDICVFLLRHPGQVFSKEDIYTTVYGYDAVGNSQTTITERMKQIRSKFQKEGINPIQTVWGVGYKWEIAPH